MLELLEPLKAKEANPREAVLECLLERRLDSGRLTEERAEVCREIMLLKYEIYVINLGRRRFAGGATAFG